MANPFIGEIKLVPYTFAPASYAFCSGQLMAIAQNNALFALIGTTYGGDGVNTFGLPDLRGRSAIHMGTGPGLSPYTIGERGGTESVTVTTAQLPTHTHDPVVAGVGGANANSPAGARAASGGPTLYASSPGTGAQMPLPLAGGSLPHDNMAPYLVMNWVICLAGIFPSRN
jgi:microcystin-dependent protein